MIMSTLTLVYVSAIDNYNICYWNGIYSEQSISDTVIKTYHDTAPSRLLTFIRGGFKTQPPGDRGFRPVPGGCHCLEQ